MAGVWTNNWRGIKNLMLIGAAVPGLSSVVDAQGTPITHYPSSGYADYAVSPLASHTISDSYYAATRLRLGTGGSVTPAATDHKLAATPNNLAYLSVANGSAVADTQNGTFSRTYTVTVQNQSAGAVTLTEWGLFTRPQTKSVDDSGGSYFMTHPVLLYHATLDTPVTLQSYEAATLDLTLTMTLDDPV